MFSCAVSIVPIMKSNFHILIKFQILITVNTFKYLLIINILNIILTAILRYIFLHNILPHIATKIYT